MSDYDFSSLNDKEFEKLSADLLSTHLGVKVERFKAGRDGGVDGRYFEAPDSEVIIQCKHWSKSGLPKLISSLKRTEATKVKKLNPVRYIFVTSLELSKTNKTEIKNIFSPFIRIDSDIFGKEDLNDLLSRNPQIEQNHYKLWIQSTHVLKIMLDAALVGRSKSKLQEITEDSKRYVITENHQQALGKLESIHSIIITGAPGIGKTSLAEQLCQFYTAQEYEFCFIENSLTEAEQHYEAQRKQVFYYDDFLGSNYLLALEHHQDTHVINFIKRIKNDSKKRFILTSRSNILNQGKHLSERFRIEKIDKNEYELSLDGLSNFDKAKIFYNHLWFGYLNEEYIEEIYKDKRYHNIIEHKNFNPRLVSFITDPDRLESINPINYWDYIKSTLDNPKDIWKHVFDNQMDEISKHILIAVSLHYRKISELKLKKFFQHLKYSSLNVDKDKLFDNAMKELTGALLNRYVVEQGVVEYSLFNPSIADYIFSTYMDDPNYVGELLACLESVEATDNILSLLNSGTLDRNFCIDLVEWQLKSLLRCNSYIEKKQYSLQLLALALKLALSSPNCLELMQKFSENIIHSGYSEISASLFDFMCWSINTLVQSPSDGRIKVLVESWVLKGDLDYDELVSLSELIFLLEPESGELTTFFKEKFIEFYSYEITRYVIEGGIFDDEFEHGFEDFDRVNDFIDDDVSTIPIDFNEAEIQEISENCSFEEIIESNREASMDYPRPSSSPLSRLDGSFILNELSEIDDLFDRG